MIWLVRFLTRLVELGLWVPIRLARLLLGGVAFNPRLGWLRYVAVAALGYVAFALLLVYVVAPVRGLVGSHFLSEKLRYDAERWLATAIYDPRGSFVGTFDPRYERDFNWTERAIEVEGHVAYADHKSIPVREVPEHYWSCLLYHEDRYLGGPLNPFGIDLGGVLKIPYSSLMRSIALRRPTLGVGGSTLPMQFARVIYKTPPHAGEGALTKLSRKIGEWWLAPVIFRELTRGGDYTPLKQWAANHIWLAQRTGGQPLQGVELTSRIVFGKEASDLTTAEQFVLASAVNKPIILLPGNERINEVRIDHWRYITEVRARHCAERLIKDEAEQKKVLFELVQMAGGPPDPRIKARLQQALDTYAPSAAGRAHANPIARANLLMPTTRFGLREELKQAFGGDWRSYVRGVTTTFDVVENLAFREHVRARVAQLAPTLGSRLNPGFTFEAEHRAETRAPAIVVVAANARGEIVRYFETGETAPYFGAALAKDRTTGLYDPAAESRAIASTGKMLAAIAIANEGRDDIGTLYLDTQAPEKGLETCDRSGTARHGRRALVAFACSLNNPLINRAAQVGQERFRALIDGFGFTMPPPAATGEGTPPSTAAVLGHVAGSPRRVHHMSAVVLAVLLGQTKPVPAPSLIRRHDFTDRELAAAVSRDRVVAIEPRRLIRREGLPLLRTLLSAPLCYQSNGTSHGTLRTLSQWCAERRGDLRLHFAKTGTSTTSDPNATVDTWATGGVQFANGAAYSYVVMVGTGSTAEPWSRSLHAAQVAAPLLETLLEDLAAHAKSHPEPALLPSPPAQPVASAETDLRAKGGRLQSNPAERERIFNRN